MASPESSVVVAGNSKHEQAGGSNGARFKSNTAISPRISMKAKILGFIFGPGTSKGEDQLATTSGFPSSSSIQPSARIERMMQMRSAGEEFSSRGKELATTSGSPSSSSIQPSTRIERLMQMKSEFLTDLEFEIESSKDHWSQLPPMTDDSELVARDPASLYDRGVLAGEPVAQQSMVSVICKEPKGDTALTRELLAILFHRFPHRFTPDREAWWKVGRKIGEGAQAENYEAVPTGLVKFHAPYIYKVFKKGILSGGPASAMA